MVLWLIGVTTATVSPRDRRSQVEECIVALLSVNALGMPHWPLWCGGGVPDKFIKIDPDVHFNLQVCLDAPSIF